jgi:hypothetical protein
MIDGVCGFFARHGKAYCSVGTAPTRAIVGDPPQATDRDVVVDAMREMVNVA